jgi:hypothetical protein
VKLLSGDPFVNSPRKRQKQAQSKQKKKIDGGERQLTLFLSLLLRCDV